MSKEESILSQLFSGWANEAPSSIAALPASGSYRRYYRITTDDKVAMGVFNTDLKENKAFLSFTESFLDAGFQVPAIYATDPNGAAYLLQDLGDVTLFGLIDEARRSGKGFTPEILSIYREAIQWLPLFQVDGAELVDYDVCYPRAAFDRQSMMWDLNYFKYYFLKLAKVPFDEQKLEDDFNAFTDLLLAADANYFMYRDFQSRNIMVSGNRPWFIDYQGGRKGPLHYDIASMLYDGKADIPDPLRQELLEEYLDALEQKIPVSREEFKRFYYGFVLIRILQALGAYGFRGYYENKPHFLKSIPYAVRNLKGLMDRGLIPAGIPMLHEVLDTMVSGTRFAEAGAVTTNLVVNVFSFSYKKGIPEDPGGKGGGFVFDCRALPNPGRFGEFRELTGRDQPVIDFLRRENEVDQFLNHVSSLVDQSVKKYMERDFTNLTVCFGCTGGQHRSVYCAEEIAKHIKEKFPVEVKVVHREMSDRVSK